VGAGYNLKEWISNCKLLLQSEFISRAGGSLVLFFSKAEAPGRSFNYVSSLQIAVSGKLDGSLAGI